MKKTTLLGISDKEASATISPTNRNPFLPDENFSAKNINAKTFALIMNDQKYIKDQSTLQISVDTEAIANKGALIKSYVFRNNGKDYFHTAPIGSTAYPLKDLFSLIYPVGSVYISTNLTSPDMLFSGTWVQISDVFLLSAGSNYSAESTGGEATHTLTVNEMPKHSHSIQYSETDGHYSGSKTEARPWGGDYSTTVGSSGGGSSHNNMPPYLTVYMWKRIV